MAATDSGSTKKLIGRIGGRWFARVTFTLVAIFVLVAAFVLPRVWEDKFKDPGSLDNGAPSPPPTVSAPAALSPEQEAAFVDQTVTSAPNPGQAVEGKDGFYFLGDAHNQNISQAVGRRAFSPEEANQEAGALAAQQTWLSERGIPMMYVVGPAKWSVYDDKLPAWAEGMPKTHIFDQLLTTYPDLPLVDVRGALQTAREQYETYSPYNSHMTGYGAYVAAQEISKQIPTYAEDVESLNVPEISDVQTVDFNNEFEGMIGLEAENPWTEPVFAEELPAYDVATADGSQATVGGDYQLNITNMPATTTNPQAPVKKKVLMLVDSNSTALTPYIAQTFSEVTWVRHWLDAPELGPSVPQLVTDVDPDLVMYIAAERHFNLPLSDGPMWDAANRFAADGTPLVVWNGGADCTGTADLSASLDCKTGTTDAGIAVELTGTSEGPATIQVASGDGSTAEVALRPGANTTYAVLPSGASGAVSVTMLNASGAVNLTSLAVRAIP